MLTALFNFAMKVIQFVVEGEPVPKGRPRFSVKTGRGYTPAKTRKAEEAIAKAYKAKYANQMFPAGIPLELSCVFYMKMPKSWSNEKAEQMEGSFVLKTPDTDNCLKTVSDSINKIAYEDDKYIAVIHAQKRWSKYPRTEITIKDITQ